jgi:serine O-acetyltransferase
VGYHRNGDVYFDHLHTDKYVTFLYFLSDTIWLEGGNISIPSKIMNLIRIISGMFLSFKCELPAHFIIFHAVGTVIGNAKYGDYLVVSQNCTINTGTRPKEVPILGKGLYLGAGAKIIGDKTVGDYVSIGVGATVYNKEIPNNSVVVNEEGKTVIRIRRHEKCMTQNYWNNTI